MNKPPAFPFYAQDFLTGVVYLTNEEIGIYIKMLCKQWTDGKIPKKRLGFLVGLDWDKFSNELRLKFNDKGDYLINERLEKEREKKINFQEKQRENGKKGGRPPKNKNQETLENTGEKTQKKPKPFKNNNPNDNQKKPLEKEKEEEIEIEIELELYPSFENFWNEYDKKVGDKEKLKKKWDKLNQETKEKIMEYIPLYKKSQPDKKYRKNAETFFNNQSWNDEIIFEPKNELPTVKFHTNR